MSARSENILAYVEARLDEWAHFYSKGNSSGLGYPPKNILQSFKETGGIYVKSTAMQQLPVNERAEEIEKLIQEMARQNSKMADALRTQYLHYCTSRFKAKMLGMSYSQFRVYVDMAHQWLAGRLSVTTNVSKSEFI